MAAAASNASTRMDIGIFLAARVSRRNPIELFTSKWSAVRCADIRACGMFYIATRDKTREFLFT